MAEVLLNNVQVVFETAVNPMKAMHADPAQRFIAAHD